MSSKSRNRARANVNNSAKVAQPVKQPAQPSSATPSAPQRPAAAPTKAAPPQPSKLTKSQRVRQEWDKFETWLSLRRAEKDKKINEKVKELMSSKSKDRKVSTASGAAGNFDIGAFEDKLNAELAEQACEEWFKRLEAAGLDAEDWTDMSPAEMEAVEAAFTPPQRPPQEVPTVTNPPHADATAAKSSAPAKPRNPYAATVEDVPLPPGAWNTPSKTPVPSKGIIGRMRPESPLMTRIASPFANGRGADKGGASSSPPAETPWEMLMNKNKSPPSASTSTSSSSRLPTADLLWQMNMNKEDLKPPTPPPSASQPDTSRYQPEPESIWDLHAKKTKLPAPAPAPAPAIPLHSKPAAQPKISAPAAVERSISDRYFDPSFLSSHDPSLQGTELGFSTTPASSTYAGTYGYVSPVFVEMEDEDFPRVQDPLPEQVVADTIRQFHLVAADAEIELRRKFISGAYDDGQLEQIVNQHLTAVEQNARKVVERWKAAREEEQRAREARLRMEKEQSVRLMEGRKFISKKNQQAKKGGTKAAQVNLLEQTFSTRAATPPSARERQQQQDVAENLWQPQPKPVIKMPELKTGFSLFGKSSTTPAPPSAPTPGAWAPPASARPVPASKNPFFSSNQSPPEPAMSPWEQRFAASREPARARAPLDAWAEENTDESDENVPLWGQNALESARNSATSAWASAMSAIGGQRSGTPAQHTVPRSAVPAHMFPDAGWRGGEDAYARSQSRAAGSAGGPNSPPVDGRFTPWRPKEDPDLENQDPAKQMASLALENLYQVAEDDDDPSQIMNAMSLYAKAATSSSRKRPPTAAGKR